MWYTNIMAIKDVIILKKAKKKKLSEGPTDTIALAEATQVLSPINLT